MKFYVQSGILNNLHLISGSKSTTMSRQSENEIRSKAKIVCLNLPFIITNLQNTESYREEYRCLCDLLKMEQQTYFVVSVSTGKNMTPLIHNCRFIEFIYMFSESASNEDVQDLQKHYCKIRGVFNTQHELEQKISEDIHSSSTIDLLNKKQLFYALYMQNLCEESIQMFPMPHETSDDICIRSISCLDYLSEQSPTLTQFNDEQRDFISFRIVIESLLSMPSLPTFDGEMMAACNELCFTDNELFDAIKASYQSYSSNKMLHQLTSGSLPLSRLMEKLFRPNFSMKQILSLRRLLVDVTEAMRGLDSCTSSLIVYCAQIVSTDEIASLRDKYQSKLFSSRSYLLTSISIPNIRTIARQAKESGYETILFEIEVPERLAKMVYKVDAERVLCPLGAVFRLRSIDLEPNGVWHVHLLHIDDKVHLVLEQLQLRLQKPLTWLTFGNYLAALHKYTEAIDYCQYLLDHLDIDDSVRPSILNNLGVILSLQKRDERSLSSYEQALTLLRESGSTDADKMEDETPTADRSDLDQILHSYREALSCSNDPYACNLYQETISSVIKKI